jgi:glucosylceramidase
MSRMQTSLETTTQIPASPLAARSENFRRARGLVIAMLICVVHLGARDARAQMEMWLTDPGGLARFEKQKTGPVPGGDGSQNRPTIDIDPKMTYQTIDGFGYTLTGGSARHLSRMSPAARARLLKELFATEGSGLGISYLRVSIGASDLDDHPFSYDDRPPGRADPELKRFSLAPDRAALLPVLKQILAIAPDLKIMGSPWSPPAWMKTNGKTTGGSLRPEFYSTYANYFVKYIAAMKAEGIRIHAVTVQNEPLHPGNNPSLLMPAREQLDFVKGHLGPAFQKAGLDTKIIIYDHNCDKPDYPISILNDREARQFVDGSAFHLYAGKISAMSSVHDAHPDKNLYFTEQWIGAPGDLRGDLAWHTRELTVGATRNWARTVLEWNLAADSKHQPHTNGGCTTCLGALTIDGDKFTRNPAYYVIAHASKLVRPGSVRIATNELPSLPNVAFRTPDGRIVLIVLNDAPTTQSFRIRDPDRVVTSTLPAGAVATYVWP